MGFEPLKCPVDEGGDECFPLFIVDDATCKDPCQEIFIGCPVVLPIAGRARIVLIARAPQIIVGNFLANETHGVIVLLTKIDVSDIDLDIILPVSKGVIILITRVSVELKLNLLTSRGVIVLLTDVDRASLTLAIALPMQAEIVLITSIDVSDFTLGIDLVVSRGVIILTGSIDVSDFTLTIFLPTSRGVIVLKTDGVPTVLNPKVDGEGLIILKTKIDKEDFSFGLTFLNSARIELLAHIDTSDFIIDFDLSAKGTIVLVTNIDTSDILLNPSILTSRGVIVLLSSIDAATMNFNIAIVLPISRGVIVLSPRIDAADIVLTSVGVLGEGIFAGPLFAFTHIVQTTNELILHRVNNLYISSQQAVPQNMLSTKILSSLNQSKFDVDIESTKRDIFFMLSVIATDVSSISLVEIQTEIVNLLDSVTIPAQSSTGPTINDMFYSEFEDKLYVTQNDPPNTTTVRVYDVSANTLILDSILFSSSGSFSQYLNIAHLNVAGTLVLGQDVGFNFYIRTLSGTTSIPGTRVETFNMEADPSGNRIFVSYGLGASLSFNIDIYTVSGGGAITLQDTVTIPISFLFGAPALLYKNNFLVVGSTDGIRVYNVSSNSFSFIGSSLPPIAGSIFRGDDVLTHVNDKLFIIDSGGRFIEYDLVL